MIIDKITTECNFDYLDEHQEHKLKAVENTKFHKFLKGNVRKTVENCGSFLAFKVFQNIKNTDEIDSILNQYIYQDKHINTISSNNNSSLNYSYPILLARIVQTDRC